MSLVERTRAGFRAIYGRDPAGVVFAPGRVNLIGEHVDYNDGLVLPMPISTGTAVAWGIADTPGICSVALDLGGERDAFDVGAIGPEENGQWRGYVRGMAAGLARMCSDLPGVNLAIAGNNPRGAGLSSSASLCIALGRAFAATRGLAPTPTELAKIAQVTEHDWAHVKCGIMDQMAIAAGKPGHALLLDCRDLSIRQIGLPADWAVVIVQSGVTRGLVDGHYNARRADCEEAVRLLGVKSLRDADAASVEAGIADPRIRARALHVVSEIERTRAAVAAIEARDIAGLGDVMRASHASLRDQFEVSVPAVDQLVDVANDAIGSNGGARMTGGGFGGAIVAVLPASQIPDFIAAIVAGFTPPDGNPLSYMIEGAGSRAAG